MAYPPLADVDDLAAALGQGDCIPANDPAAAAALAWASALARSIARQTFTVVTDDTKDFRTDGAELWLPERPVRDVSAVEAGGCGPGGVDGGWAFSPLAPSAYCWTSAGYMRGPFGYREFARVTYSHGYDEVPADVVAVVADMAARRYSSGGASGPGSSLASETIGSYSYSTRAPDGPYGLPQADYAVLTRYRPQGGAYTVQTPSATVAAFNGYGYGSAVGW